MTRDDGTEVAAAGATPDAAGSAGARALPRGWPIFIQLLVNTAVANLTTNFLWFALVFWVYLETRSILATGVLGGAYMLLIALCSMYFGSIVDRHRKLTVMRISAWISVFAFSGVAVMYVTVPRESLLTISGPWFWAFTLVLLGGCIVELMRNLALSTTVTMLIDSEHHAHANGLVGTVQGIAFIATSVCSGLSVGILGMGPTIIIALVCTLLPLVHLHLLRVHEPELARDAEYRPVDFRGGMRAVRAVPGLFALILFSTFNNLTGGVFMTLLDPYGLTMFSVEVWGIVFGLASVGMIIGGLLVARFGLGANPIRTLLVFVAIMGLLGIVFGLREYAWLFIGGIFAFMLIMPIVEAAEQTVIQKVVPFDAQGRVFGFAMTFEAATAPITAFLVAPIAEFWVVPYLDTDVGRAQWSWLLGEGEARGMALLFVCAGVLSIVLAVSALCTKTYRTLSRSYAEVRSTSP